MCERKPCNLFNIDNFPLKIGGIFIFVRSCPNNFLKYFWLFALLIDTLYPKVTIPNGKRIKYKNLCSGQKKISGNSVTHNSANIELVLLFPNNHCGKRESCFHSFSRTSLLHKQEIREWGGCLLCSGNDMIRLFPCKMQFCLDMHVWKDESYANHVSRVPCEQLCATNSLKSKHCIRLLALLSV